MSENLFIVPHDFTSVGDTALKYAMFLAKPRKSSIMLLHIVKDAGKKKVALKKLEDIISNLDLQVGGNKIEPKVIEGSIFDDIPRIAKEHEARLIIMGTHGATGMQKLFGSYAMKVITHSHIPFLVVQDTIRSNKLDKILVPVTTEKESFQSFNIVGEIARTFESTVTILAEKQTDIKFYTQLKARIGMVEEQVEEKGVQISHEIIDSNHSLHKKVIKYAKDNSFDLIAVAYDSSSIFPQFERYTQSLITNDANIPCLVVNARLLQKYYY